jgi:hypothetical protein
VRKEAAFSFETELDLAGLREKLNASGRRTWVDRDSDSYGDYLSTSAHPDYGFYKIYPHDGGYVLTIKFAADRPTFADEYAEIERIALEEILPSIGARGVTPRETWD